MSRINSTIKDDPLLTAIAKFMDVYSTDIEQIDNELRLTFNSVRMRLSIDTFTLNATIVAEVLVLNDYENEESSDELYAGCVLVNTMNRNMYPYNFVWEETDRTIEAQRQTFQYVLRLQ